MNKVEELIAETKLKDLLNRKEEEKQKKGVTNAVSPGATASRRGRQLWL